MKIQRVEIELRFFDEEDQKHFLTATATNDTGRDAAVNDLSNWLFRSLSYMIDGLDQIKDGGSPEIVIAKTLPGDMN